MAKDTFYFSHDFNARTDDKIKNLIRKHGMRGYGIFWAIVEDLYNNANALRLDCEGIAYDMREDCQLVTSVIHDFDFFIIEGDIFGSASIGNRLDERNAKSVKARENAHKRWAKDKNDANAMPPHSEGNAIKKGNELNETNGKEENEPPILEQKKHLIPEMANKFKDINSNYAFDEVIDYPAIKSFAEFIANRQNKSRVISDLNLTQIDNIVTEFGKIANWYKNSNCTKSLETLAKFEIQKIFNELAQSGQVGGGIKLTTNISLT